MSDDIFIALAENAPQANFIFDLHTNRFSYINPAFKKICGISTATVSLKQIVDLIPADDQQYLRLCYQKLNKGIIQQKIEFRLLIHNHEHWISLSPSLITTDYGQIIVGHATDISDERMNLDVLKKYTNKKNSTLNMLSHDLRGPLGIAKTVTQMLEKKLEDPQLKNLVSTISKILAQTIDLVTDLIGREFLETTDVALVKSRVDIAAKLKDYVDEIQRTHELRKIKFTFSSSEHHVYISLDEAKFMQVVNNLTSNALKFTNDNGTISIQVQDQNESVLIIFADNGIGIPAEYQLSVFDRFTDARRRGLKGEDTVGLGLSIVKKIIEWHNGKIWFKSTEGEGTKFFVEIPKS